MTPAATRWATTTRSAWCKPYDGGRFWATALGHFPSHYDEPAFMQHLVGGVKYVAGIKDGDCGGTVWDNYEKIALDQNTSAPFAMDVAPDGKVFYTELVRGEIRVCDPQTQTTTPPSRSHVYSGGEDGLLGIALANDFATAAICTSTRAGERQQHRPRELLQPPLAADHTTTAPASSTLLRRRC